MSKLVFFDLETGGLDPKRHPIIQFAGICVEDWKIIEEVEIKLHFNIDACDTEALEMNTFNADAWREEAIEARPATTLVSQFFRRHADVPIPKKSGTGDWYACQLAGHNAQAFDRPFITELFSYHDEFCVGSLLVWDTLQLAMTWSYLLPENERPKNLKLGTLAEFLGVEMTEAHDALADVRANIEIAKRIMNGLGTWLAPKGMK